MTKTLSPTLTEQVSKAAAVLGRGGIVAYPTDTVYGLGADIYNDEAVKRVFAAKERPLDLPFPVLIANIEQLDDLAAGQTAFSGALAARFWPGGLTIIFNKAPGLRSLALAGGGKVGVRMPSHPAALQMIRELGRPIVGTSANIHDGAIALTAGDVRRELGNRVDFILDAGRSPGGRESTVVDVTVNPPAILRQGPVSEKDIMAVYIKTTGGK
jgi:L-threonylcarbamoyladenylate synthase